MKFKSDKHRKGMFAAMFGRGKDKRSRVNPASVTNMEIKVLSEKYTPHKQEGKGNIISQSGHFDVIYRDTKTKDEWRESHRVSNTRAELDLGAILEIAEIEEASKKTPKRTVDVLIQEGETVRSERLGGNHPRQRSVSQLSVNYIPPPEEEVLKLALEKKFKKWTKAKKKEDRLTRAELDMLAVIATPKQSREGRNRDVENRLEKHFKRLKVKKVEPKSKINLNIAGTSIQGELLGISYETLVKLFGLPRKRTSDKFKIDAEWHIELDNGEVVTIYNWKDGKAYLGRKGEETSKITDWNIGSKTKKSAMSLERYVRSSQ